uniref:(northern house mosquito) hypothetical protein n=2 Tax=Culex pipiens TaxID=7175 RepID=A0A8D8HQK3_CULPI
MEFNKLLKIKSKICVVKWESAVKSTTQLKFNVHTVLVYQIKSNEVRHLPLEPNNIIRRLEWMERHPESRDVVQGTLDHMAHHNQQFRRRGLKPVPICREPLTTFSIAIYYPRKSMLTGQFGHQLLQIQAAGLTNYWIKQYGDYEFFGRSEGSAEPRQMSNEHLMVVCELYGLLIVLSVVIFAMELISDRIVGLKRVLEEIVGH